MTTRERSVGYDRPENLAVKGFDPDRRAQA